MLAFLGSSTQFYTDNNKNNLNEVYQQYNFNGQDNINEIKTVSKSHTFDTYLNINTFPTKSACFMN